MKTRRFQFSTRHLMIAIAVMAVVFNLGLLYWNLTAQRRKSDRMIASFLALGAHWSGEKRFDPVPPVIQLAVGQVTDAELARNPLPDLPNLRSFSIGSTLVTDVGLKYVDFTKMPNLESLNLSGTRITDSGLSRLGLERLAGLKTISLDRTGITDAGLVHLKGLQSLSTISLANTAVTDAGLRHLTVLNTLEHLYLNGTDVTEHGLPLLKALPHLKTVTISKSATSYDGEERLRQLLPGVGINSDRTVLDRVGP